MSQPLDPNEMYDDATEFDYGPGMFAPGIANNQGQDFPQDDFGVHMQPPMPRGGNTPEDIYAKAVADRRTDPTNPESSRDFETFGNPDRYGPQPALVQAETQPDISQNPDHYGRKESKLKRAP
jgi:hypothetical protein